MLPRNIKYGFAAIPVGGELFSIRSVIEDYNVEMLNLNPIHNFWLRIKIKIQHN